MKLNERLAEANGTKEARYAHRVNSLIRRRYTLSEELSLLRRRDEAPEAFAAYSAYAESCKERAKRGEGDA